MHHLNKESAKQPRDRYRYHSASRCRRHILFNYVNETQIWVSSKINRIYFLKQIPPYITKTNICFALFHIKYTFFVGNKVVTVIYVFNKENNLVFFLLIIENISEKERYRNDKFTSENMIIFIIIRSNLFINYKIYKGIVYLK